MSVIILLIVFSLAIALFFLVYFLWAVRSGQYDDNITPAMRMLNDDPPPRDESTE
ncbi:MAG: cbb3-type cytochrome oxidase assembly protein CcoS [Candidatus Kapabacteria bacterium]|nr:cbb3-type cytochrome oxidase assembly protein CcoS [Candidatus Kapabacteria bacterium]